ncbi:MAG TPA: glycine cleavage T C-terminal barrel domain-containing protein [Micromonosporaceae bacterium]
MKSVYTDTIEEYQALRSATGLIDYEGAGYFTVSGPGAAEFVGSVCTRPVDFLLEGQISVALVLREDGTILGEAQLHCRGAEYLIQVWPAQADAVRAHLMAVAGDASDATVTDVSADYHGFGVEGPESFRIVQKFLDFPIASMAYRSFATSERDGVELMISRTGVTGEYGYNVLVPTGKAAELREELVGLGARESGIDAVDICRMETRFTNLEKETAGDVATPFDLGLQWMVDFNHEFIGSGALADAQQSQARQPVCWVADDEGTEAPSAGTSIIVGGQEVGAVTHAVFSPSLKRVIGTARVDSTVAASGLGFGMGDREIQTISAPFLVATSFGVSME